MVKSVNIAVGRGNGQSEPGEVIFSDLYCWQITQLLMNSRKELEFLRSFSVQNCKSLLIVAVTPE